MVRLIQAAAAAAAMLPLVPATSEAQSAGVHYSAVPVAAPEKERIVTRRAVWHCDAQRCVAPRASSRDAVICQSIAREIGRLASFTANGSPFDAAALSECNAYAQS
ncbi:CC_3452 family protein [Stakelama tenebrarum]|uniref:UrcA family protein n=1 Tax=Stakelama tenebrarum TaxID=2711215 RepID=A0A6G6Y9R4_9SPHN|nr:hypothetical protein [Sphingosinithalassobacter tenebrarum]QIG81682.1 hypothetical protein G5C33_19110 [Sphingosinithalassobacter tenebrarum]